MDLKNKDWIRFELERELEHLAWVKRNFHNNAKLVAKSTNRIKQLELQLIALR